jgi:4-amino-4-deoxy-L-arabinose transferase-like glycosyltransferase
LSQARELAAGRLSQEIPTDPAYAWTNAEWTLIPLAHVRAPQPGRMVATYPPGLPLLMAALVPFGVRAEYLLVPLFGALLVYFTWRAGHLLGDSLAGALAALLLSMSPTFLLQLVQPMSDVPAAACWAGAVVCASREGRREALFAGLLTGLAVMIRPNLAPLAVITLALIVARRVDRAQRTVAGLGPVVTMTCLLLVIQTLRYGSPLGSGYGKAGDLFSLASIGENLNRYPGWITSTHTPLIWLWVIAPLVLKGARRPLLVALVALIIGTWCAYLPYVAFRPDEWFYTRFLLPAIPFMLLLSSAVLIALIRRAPQPSRPVLTATVTLVFGLALARASAPQLTNTAPHERRYEEAGTFVRDSLPANAVVLAAQHSGSVRFYANRTIVRWDVAPRSELDAIVAAIRGAGSLPFLVVDAAEVPEFRERFAGQEATDRLRPLAEFGVTRVYSVE